MASTTIGGFPRLKLTARTLYRCAIRIEHAAGQLRVCLKDEIETDSIIVPKCHGALMTCDFQRASHGWKSQFQSMRNLSRD